MVWAITKSKMPVTPQQHRVKVGTFIGKNRRNINIKMKAKSNHTKNPVIWALFLTLVLLLACQTVDTAVLPKASGFSPCPPASRPILHTPPLLPIHPALTAPLPLTRATLPYKLTSQLYLPSQLDKTAKSILCLPRGRDTPLPGPDAPLYLDTPLPGPEAHLPGPEAPLDTLLPGPDAPPVPGHTPPWV